MYEARQHKEAVSRQIEVGRPRQSGKTRHKEPADWTAVSQRMYKGWGDKEYTPPKSDAPPGYKDIAQTKYDRTHSDLNGKVKVLERSGKGPFLWWEPEYRRDIKPDFPMQGSRAEDKSFLGEENGYTWHHCGDWRPGGKYGKCTMQQVDTDEHSSFGHTGAVQQYEEETKETYG